MTFVLVRVNKSNDYNVNLHYCNCHQRALGNKTACILSFFLNWKCCSYSNPQWLTCTQILVEYPPPWGATLCVCEKKPLVAGEGIPILLVIWEPRRTGNPRTRGTLSIQPKFLPVRPGKVVHLKRWTSFFETFPVGPNRSTEFLTEISWNFGWMDRTRGYPVHASSTSHTGHPYNGFGSFGVRSGIGN